MPFGGPQFQTEPIGSADGEDVVHFLNVDAVSVSAEAPTSPM
jgi:hypothetical protein